MIVSTLFKRDTEEKSLTFDLSKADEQGAFNKAIEAALVDGYTITLQAIPSTQDLTVQLIKLQLEHRALHAKNAELAKELETLRAFAKAHNH